MLLVTEITAPPSGATVFAVMLNEPELPPVTGLVTVPNPARPIGPTAITVETVLPKAVACIETPTVEGDWEAVAVKDADIAPAGITTEVGTDTNALFVDSDTVAPPLGAAPVRYTVTDAVRGPTTDVGAVTRSTAQGCRRISVETDPPDDVAVRVTVVGLVTVLLVARVISPE